VVRTRELSNPIDKSNRLRKLSHSQNIAVTRLSPANGVNEFAPPYAVYYNISIVFILIFAYF
jgi:hypothetical protein